MMPSLMQLIRKEAPNIDLDIVHLSPNDTINALESHNIDLDVSMDLTLPSTINSRILLHDRMVCVMSETHPLAQRSMTLRDFLEQEHIKVSMSPLDGRYVDNSLAKSGKIRKISINVPHWLLVPHLLRHSNMVAVYSERLARCDHSGLIMRELPFPSDGFNWCLY
ncbi:LysR substrate-binding domain-containing protein [Novacetimonas hansenii]|uniref:LysR substrate-binding domain-containing protein n=1 Tax=Novacetimonas hansenii TaxID=436 RepID=UPI0038D137E5